LEAIIKNIITIAMAIYLFKNLKADDRSTNKLIVPFAIFAFAAFLMFLFYPFCPCLGENTDQPLDTGNGVVLIDEDSTDVDLPLVGMDTTTLIVKNDTQNVVATTPEPAPTVSKFSSFNVFGNKKVNLDKGKKIVCCFAPGCDHCQETAKLIAEMAKKNQIPPVYILFMDEEVEKIPEFLSTSRIKASHTVLDIVKFWTVMKNDGTPAVYYLWNGNVQYQCEGIDANAFNADAFLKAVKGN
jgi:thiol-disulfide isomerase/thioredoxin